MFYLSAFLVGFLGSFHCAGMCGPIALALPGSQTSWRSVIQSKLLYNGGRIMTYSLLGLLVGLIGHTLAMAGFQKALSIGSGVMILAIVVGSVFYQKIQVASNLVVRFTGFLKKQFGRLFKKKSPQALFLIGAVNGLLPCGFVYLALAAAAAAGNFSTSVAYMFLFGLGTLPMMLFISLAGNFFGKKFNRLVSRATPYVAIALAILLITRGITMSEHSCCHR